MMTAVKTFFTFQELVIADISHRFFCTMLNSNSVITLGYARTLHNFPSFENGFRTMDMKTKIVKHKFGWVDFVRCCQIVCKF